MNRKVKVIRKGMEAQYPISGGVQLVAGGGGRRRENQSLPVRILGGAGSIAGGALGALGALAGRHRSAGGLLQSAISGHAQGKTIGRGLGEKVGGLVGVGGPKAASAARYLAAKPSDRVVSDLNREGAKRGAYRPRLTYRGQPIVGGKVVPVTGGSPRTTEADAVSDSNVNRVLDATKLGSVRVVGPGEQVGRGPFNMNPLGVAVTGNPLDMGAMSREHEADLKQRMNRPSGKVGVDNTRQLTMGETFGRKGIDFAGNPIANSPIAQAGMAAANMIPPVAAGAKEEIAADEEAAEAAMNLDTTPDPNLPPAFSRPPNQGQGTVYGPGQAPSRSLFAGTSAGRSANQRRADLRAGDISRLSTEIDINQAFANQGNDSFYSAFPDYNDPNALVNTGEPMDIAFRLLKMMSFYI